MAVAVIADSHLDGPGEDCGPLVAQLDALAHRDCERLVLLGDIFQVWVGLSGFETPGILAVVEALRQLRAGGLPIHYIEGNRDFFLAEGPHADAFDSVGTELAFETAGVRYLAVHGDGLDDADIQYRFWRWLSKSAGTRLAMRFLPRGLSQRFVGSTERGLSKTNFKHKVRLPERVIRNYGARRLAEGHDVLLLGHFHEPRSWQVGAGEVRLLNAWFRSRQVEWLPREEA